MWKETSVINMDRDDVHCVEWARMVSRKCVVHVDVSTGLLVCVHVCDI